MHFGDGLTGSGVVLKHLGDVTGASWIVSEFDGFCYQKSTSGRLGASWGTMLRGRLEASLEAFLYRNVMDFASKDLNLNFL